MSDRLEALSVERLNLAVSKAVNAAYSVPVATAKHKQKLANSMPGTISVPSSVPSSAPLVYKFNMGTQPPVLAVSNSGSKMSASATLPIAGTIIPVKRQTPMVQLTPISSCTSVNPSQGAGITIPGRQNLPILLSKTPQTVSTNPVQLQVVGPDSSQSLSNLRVVTNVNNEQQKHAGTLILPGGRSLNVQSVLPTIAANQTTESQLMPNTANVHETKKGTYYLSLPLSKNTFQNVKKNLSNEIVTDITSVEEVPMKQDASLPDDIGDETSNDALELSRNLDQHSSYLAAHSSVSDLTNRLGGKPNSVSMDHSPAVVAEDIKALVNLVKYSSIPQHETEDTRHITASNDKENQSIISAAFEMVGEDQEETVIEEYDTGQLRQIQLNSNEHSSSTDAEIRIVQISHTAVSPDGIYCVSCNAMLDGPCKLHTDPMVHISDSSVLSYARASLPKVLQLKTSLVHKNETGVFTRDALVKNVRFGPMIGEKYSNEEFEKSSIALSQFWLVFNNNGDCVHMLYNANEETANWMRFVRRAKRSEEQNVVAFQQGADIYFITNKEVGPDTELLYWFSKDTAALMGLPPAPEAATTKCKICKKEFTKERLLNQHIKFKHPDMSTRKFRCQLCTKAFTSSSKLNTHIQGHAGIKPHKCNICNKQFTDRSNLRMHMSIHTGERKFSCGVCSRTFRQKAHLESHILTHTKEKPVKCKFCDKAFARASDKKQHEFRHTKETIYKCTEAGCNKIFYRLQNLRKHEKIHIGIKSYLCIHCKKGFHTNYHLKRHTKTCVLLKLRRNEKE